MRIAVLGAGAMGSWFGGHLTKAGHDVYLLTTNAAHIAAVRERGLEMRGGGEISVVHPEIGDPREFADEVDLVLTLTKTFQLDSALKTIAPVIGPDTGILSLQNGLGSAEVISRYIHVDNICIGVTMLPVDRIGPGIVEAKGQGGTWFGHKDNKQTPVTENISKAFANTSIDIRHDAEVLRRVWEKVAFNTGMNAVCALTNSTPGLISTQVAVQKLVRDAAQEVSEVAIAEGVTIDLKSVYETIQFACEKHADHVPSMLQDIRDGKPTEVGALNTAVVLRARNVGIATPVNEMLASLVILAEIANSKS